MDVRLPLSKLQRIAVYGGSGSGKTHFSKKLGDMLDIPVFHLDDIFHVPNWKQLNTEDFRSKIKEITSQDKWIIDGNYSKIKDIVLSKTTFVFILKIPLLISLYRLLTRTWERKYNTGRFEITPLPKNVIDSEAGENFAEAIYFLGTHAIKYYFIKYKKVIKQLKLENINYHTFIDQGSIDSFFTELAHIE